MNSQLEHSLHNPIGLMFDNENFKALVYDFYYSLDEADSNYTISDIYRWIFSDLDMYAKFLQFYKEQGFSYSEKDKDHTLKKILNLLTFEQTFKEMGTRHKDDVSMILDITNGEIFDQSLHSYIPGTKINFWNGLRYAIYNKIPLNNFGQILYYLEDTDVGFLVYSHELGKHHVNKEGKVISREEHYREEEKNMLKHFLKLQKLIVQAELPDELQSDDYKKEYIGYKKAVGQKGDTEKLLELRFRMSLHEWMRNTKNELKDIRTKGFGFGDIKAVAGTEHKIT